MSVSKSEFSIEIPIQIEHLKLFFFTSQKSRALGATSANFPHNHGKLYELRYVAKGRYVQRIENDAFALSAGDMILIHPHEYHYQTDQECDTDLLQFSLRFFVKPPSEDADVRQKRAYQSLTEVLHSTRLLHDEGFSMLPYFEKLMDEFSQKRYGYFPHMQAVCMLITTELLRLCGQKSAHIFPSKELTHSFYWRDQLDSFLRYRYTDNVKLEDLAAAIGLSPRQASRVFVREFGMSYINKLIEVRLQQAKFLLTHTDKEAQEICHDCGFQSYGYFSARFRKNTGMTPLEYRARVGNRKKPNS